MRMTYWGSNTSVSMKSVIVINPVKTYQAGRPSRYKTMINILYIKALPGSGCGNIRITGNRMIARACICLFVSFKLICVSLKNFAKAKEVAALANSEGCIVKLPIAYQQR